MFGAVLLAKKQCKLTAVKFSVKHRYTRTIVHCTLVLTVVYTVQCIYSTLCTGFKACTLFCEGYMAP